MSRFLLGVLACVLLAACSVFGGSGDDTSGGGPGDHADGGSDGRVIVTGGPADYAFTITATADAVPVIQGQSSTVTLTVVRGAQLTEPIVVTVTDLRDGVTASSPTITETTGDLVVAAANGIDQGDASGTINATAMSAAVGPVTVRIPLKALVRGVSGSLDTRFGNGGKVASLFGPAFLSPLLELFVAADDSIYAVGSCNDVGISHVCAAHVTADGAIDPMYGSNGYGLLALSDPNAAFLQADGRIVVAGGRQLGFGIIGRFDPTGHFDSTFGPNSGSNTGTETLSGNTGEYAVTRQAKLNDLVFASDGPFQLYGEGPSGHDANRGGFTTQTIGGPIVALSARNDGSAVDGNVDAIWLNNNNVFFEEFGASDGVPVNGTLHQFAVAGASRSTYGIPDSVTLADGSIAVPITGSSGVSVLKVTTQGAGAPGFGSGGVAPAISGYGDGGGIAAEADGKLLVAFLGGSGATLVRLDGAGNVDPTFGAGGVAKTVIGSSTSSGRKVAVQKSGRILVTVENGGANIAALWP